MKRVTSALIWHELKERTHDRWVLVISILFALLATGVGLYGQAAGENAANLTGPSLVTLASIFVPLVALVLGHDAIVGERERNTLGLLLSLPFSKSELVFAKYVGRLLALLGAIALGLGSALFFVSSSGGFQMTLRLLGHTTLLGAAFLSCGIFISTILKRQTTAASLVVTVWFLFVFFYDLGLLGILVATDGAIDSIWISRLVLINPAGLFRVQMMAPYVGEEVFSDLGMAVGSQGALIAGFLWAFWIVVPIFMSGVILIRQKVV